MEITIKHLNISDQNNLLRKRKDAVPSSVTGFWKRKNVPAHLQNDFDLRLYLVRPLFQEEGIALMMTLWIMVLLIAIVTEFTHGTRTEINTTKNFKEEIESYYFAEAGINLAITEILQDAEFHALDEAGEIAFGRKKY